MAFNEELWDAAIAGSTALRFHLFKDEPKYFAMYYFPEYFTFATPDFHEDMFQDCLDLTNGTIDESMWCVFREGAKTSIAKIALVVWAICYKHKRFIGWDSYDGDNSEAALFDVTVALQSNRRIIRDFGHLYYKKKAKTAYEEAKMKRIKSFITENGVKVVAFTTQESVRGRLQAHERLDLMIFDDFENIKTKDSQPVTQKVIDHINEYRTGMPAYASALYLCNYITDRGSVAHFMEAFKDKPRIRTRFVPIVNQAGVIAWPDKYVKTKAQAVELNKGVMDPHELKSSLEGKEESLGKELYQTDMMLNPSAAGDLFFDREKVNAAILKAKEPMENNADLKIWAKFNPKHRFGMGADTAEGIGADSNASAIIDFTQKPAILAASFADNSMAPNVFGWELKRQGGLYGFPYLVPEINQTGYATVSELINAEYPNMYVREVMNKTTNRVQKEFGWKANTGTKWEIMGDFKSAFEDGEINIYDKGLLEEMKYFSKQDARLTNRQKGATRHFDKLRAAALAWHARYNAQPSAVEREVMYKAPTNIKTPDLGSYQM